MCQQVCLGPVPGGGQTYTCSQTIFVPSQPAVVGLPEKSAGRRPQRSPVAIARTVHYRIRSNQSVAQGTPVSSCWLFFLTALVMKRSELYRTLQSRQRYGADLPETTLEFEPVSRKLWLGVEKSEADAHRVAQAILDFLDDCGEPKTEVEVNSAVKGRNDVKRKAIRSLVGEGAVLRSGRGTKGDPFKYANSSDSCPQHTEGTRVRESEKLP